MHIAIEGMDGVGKTTAARNLAKILNFKLVEKPLHYMLDENEDNYANYIRIRDYIDYYLNFINLNKSSSVKKPRGLSKRKHLFSVS